MSPRALSVDVVSVEDTACLIKVFRQNVLALFKLCPWLQHARVIDRICSLKAKILSKSRSPDAHCEMAGLVGHLIYASTACSLGIQSGSNEGFGNSVYRAFIVQCFICTLRAGEGAPSTIVLDQKELAEIESLVRCQTSARGTPHLLIVRTRPTILHRLPCRLIRPF